MADILNNDFINRLDDSSSLVDILINVENFLDSMDLYVFKNWFNGEIVDGPNISKYWVSLSLFYNFDDMPDPDGALMLEEHGAKVVYELRQMEDTEIKPHTMDVSTINQVYDLDGGQDTYGNNSVYDATNKVPNTKSVWIITIKIPRIFVDEANMVDDDIINMISTKQGETNGS